MPAVLPEFPAVVAVAVVVHVHLLPLA